MEYAALYSLCKAIARSCVTEKIDRAAVHITISYSDYQSLRRDERILKLVEHPLPRREFQLLGVNVRINYGA